MFVICFKPGNTKLFSFSSFLADHQKIEFFATRFFFTRFFARYVSQSGSVLNQFWLVRTHPGIFPAAFDAP